MRSIEIVRHSVCAADDQANPVTLEIQARGSDSLRSFVARILSHDFLQFSSSHASIIGFASGQPIVRIHADFLSGHQPEFLISPDSPVESCLQGRRLEFAWADPANSLEPSTRHGSA